MHGTIYLLTNSVNGKRYIGQTTKASEIRFKEHVWFARANFPGILNSAIRKHGEKAFTVKCLCECDSQEELDKKEIFYIAELKTRIPEGYNMTDGGRIGTPGWKPSNKTRQNISKGRVGIPCTEETKAKISKANKGRQISTETRRKLSIAALGRLPSEETKRKMSEASSKREPRSGWHHTEEARRKISEHKRKEFCKYGHPFNKENTYNRPGDKARVCLLCYYLKRGGLPEKLKKYLSIGEVEKSC